DDYVQPLFAYGDDVRFERPQLDDYVQPLLAHSDDVWPERLPAAVLRERLLSLGPMLLAAIVRRSLVPAMLLAFLIVTAGCGGTKVESTTSDVGAFHAKLLSSESDAQNVQPPQFHGYACTVDCSGHEAGYQWAENHGIDDRD